MENRGNRRRASWRWGMGVWTAAVVLGSGLTLWLQDAAEPPPTAGWEDTRTRPVPGVPEDREFRCVPPELPPDLEDGVVATACLYAYDASGGMAGSPVPGWRPVRQ
ncbi:hypothetical protein ACE1N8_23690 [Streptomyces sp. DSM 116494]|uniref:hypothetical protein n=1 Tax=Streptomyces okerensis TaxID=3344655 RepID=UPI00388E8CE4